MRATRPQALSPLALTRTALSRSTAAGALLQHTSRRRGEGVLELSRAPALDRERVGWHSVYSQSSCLAEHNTFILGSGHIRFYRRIFYLFFYNLTNPPFLG